MIIKLVGKRFCFSVRKMFIKENLNDVNAKKIILFMQKAINKKIR